MADGSAFWEWAPRRLPLTMQSENTECGLACLTMIACYHGYDTDLASLRRRFSISLRGATLDRLIEIANSLKFESRAVRIEIDDLNQIQCPCILHWNLNHFVVLRRVTRSGAEIFDPAHGRTKMSLDDVSKHFTGIALELWPTTDFSPLSDRRRISITALTGRINGILRAAIQVLGLAFAIEALALLMPFQMQIVLDQALPSADGSLIFVLSLGFFVLSLLQAALAMARAWIISWFGASLNSQWFDNLFGHLLKLPLGYFEKRNIGDVVSRFSSLQAIQNTITGSFVEAFLDGLLGSLTLIILWVYSASMTTLALVIFLLYALLRAVVYNKLRRVNEEQLIYSARQQTELIESVHGIQAIKLANQQEKRKARARNVVQEASKRAMYSQRFTSTFVVVSQTLFGLQRIILIAIGARLAVEEEFSAGMLVAYLAYADQFGTKLGSLVDKLVEFRMLRLHAERIADIALSEPEQYAQGVYGGPDLEPRINIRNLSFRYAESEPWVLQNLDLQIDAGNSVAIVAPSGYGKSTLAKLLVGLLEPTDGCIEIDGVDIRKYGLKRYRDLVGAVMQDDTLFSGTLADNIALFDNNQDMQMIVEAAQMAEIHEEIAAMPMGYESVVGDMGSSLSGGQKQRIILARALYRKPRILLLDEATSHLDGAREMLINKRIKDMKMTRIIIAHRQETIASADCVVDLPQLSQQRRRD